jgi:hypothetical protein
MSENKQVVQVKGVRRVIKKIKVLTLLRESHNVFDLATEPGDLLLALSNGGAKQSCGSIC